MFSTRRRYLIFAVSALLPLVSLAAGIYLKFWVPSHAALLAILVVVSMLSTTSSYYAYLQPLRDLSSAVTLLLDCVGQRIIDAAAKDHIDARLNYLSIFRPASWLFLRKYFRVAWGIGMKYKPDNTARFHTSKGVAGRALHDRRETLANLEKGPNRTFGFSEEELEKFPPLTAIWSVSIFELDRSGNATGNILGTINLDSETRGAGETFERNPEYQRLLHELQDLVSKVASC
jgi:hypothetical protein